MRYKEWESRNCELPPIQLKLERQKQEKKLPAEHTRRWNEYHENPSLVAASNVIW